MTADVDTLTDVLAYGLLVVAFVAGIVLRRGRGWIAVAGIGVAVVVWALGAGTGAFEDGESGTFLALVFGVPIYAVAWALAVGAGYLFSRLVRRLRGPSRFVS